MEKRPRLSIRLLLMERTRKTKGYFGLALPAIVLLAGGGSFVAMRDGARPDGSLRTVESPNTQPAETTRFKMEFLGQAPMPGFAVSFTIEGGALYACMSKTGMAIYDVSDPKAPRLVEHQPGLITEDHPDNRVFLHAIAEKDRLIVADRLRGVSVYDRTDPLHPRFLWGKRIAGNNNDQPVWVHKSGDKYYLACGGAGLHMLPEDFGPETESVPLLKHFDHTRQVSSFGEERLLVADNYDTGLQVMNIADPAEARVEHIFQTGTFTDSILTIGPRAILANRVYGFTVVDLTRPADPFISSYHHTPLGTRSIVKSMALWRERYLLAGNFYHYIDVFDLEKEGRPIFEHRHPILDEVNVMAVDGDLLYLSTMGSNLLGIYRLSLDEAVYPRFDAPPLAG